MKNFNGSKNTIKLLQKTGKKNIYIYPNSIKPTVTHLQDSLYDFLKDFQFYYKGMMLVNTWELL